MIADWKPPHDPLAAVPDIQNAPLPRGFRMKVLKFPDHAARGERCPWCLHLKRGRCTGCGQQYGESDDTKGSTARRVTRKAEAKLSSPSVPPVEVPVSVQANGASEASAPSTPPQPVVLVLPEPPAANTYLRRHGNVTYKTREAKAYCALIAAMTQEHRINGGPTFPEGDVTVVVVWHRQRKAGDLGERTKVLYDSLQGTVYANDKQIAQDWRRRCDEHPEIPKGHVRIEVSAI